MSGKAWDGGDPWDVDSDDDDFVSRAGGSSPAIGGPSSRGKDGLIRSDGIGASTLGSTAAGNGVGAGASTSKVGLGAAPAIKAAGASAFSFWGSSPRSGSPVGQTSTKKQQQAQAPPARPHMISVGSYKTKRGGGTEAGSSNLQSVSHASTSNGNGARERPSGRSSWLIVDPENLTPTSSGFRSASVALGEPPSSPTSSRNASRRSGSPTEPSNGEELLKGTGGLKDSGAAAGTETTALRAALSGDLDSLIEDPTSALSRLSLRWSSNAGEDDAPFSPLSPGGGGLAAQPNTTHNGSSPSTPTETGGGGSYGKSSGKHTLRATTASMGPQSEDVPEEGLLPSVILERKQSQRSTRRRQQFLDCLLAPSVDLSNLRSLSWKGVPAQLRPLVWQLLLGYLPAAKEARKTTLARKRAEYDAGVKMAFNKGVNGLDQSIWHQISIDVPRTNPGRPLWQREATQRALERILYLWAIRHPACGYVQGINDLATPFFEVFLSAYITLPAHLFDPSLLPPSILSALEADTFWCLSKLLDGIQDNYVFAQPGIQRQVRRLGELVARIDAPLHSHLNNEGVEYMQFAFRWMNCLLMREMSVQSIIRLWDTYLAEGPDAFSDFHLYVCAVFLHKWTNQLQEMDFQGIIMHLQSLPTQNWSDKDAEMLLSEAFMYKTLFGNSAHLNK